LASEVIDEEKMNKAVASVAVLATISVFLGCREPTPLVFEANLVQAHKYQMTRGLPMDQVVEDTQWALDELFGTPNDPKIPDFIAENEDYADLIRLDRLQIAAGPEVYDAEDKLVSGLYRKYCANCHGVTGNGRGPIGTQLNPYPRDYRMGIFKFKSTTRGAKPTREDIAQLLRHGIGGTAMNPIPGMTEEGIQALVDYVIYLSWRGEVERATIDAAMYDLDLEAGERIVTPSSATLVDQELEPLSDEQAERLEAFEEAIDEAYQQELARRAESRAANLSAAESLELFAQYESELDDEQQTRMAEQQQGKFAVEDRRALVDLEFENLSAIEVAKIRDEVAAAIATGDQLTLRQRQHTLDLRERFEENWGYIQETVEDIAGSWLDAEDDVTDVEPRGDIPVPANRAEFVAMMEGDRAAELQASVDRGHKLFTSELVGCAKCHGKLGKGDGQTTDYDDWTKDWTTNVGLDPKETAALMPLLARGALQPHNIKPRNFAEGIFRGGSDPDTLFRRIANGIAGTPMPAATMVEGEFSRQDIWHLINFIRSLDNSPLPETETPAVPLNETASLP
jgi:mono/diheme cytochrome c family protein